MIHPVRITLATWLAVSFLLAAASAYRLVSIVDDPTIAFVLAVMLGVAPLLLAYPLPARRTTVPVPVIKVALGSGYASAMLLLLFELQPATSLREMYMDAAQAGSICGLLALMVASLVWSVTSR